MKSTTISQGAIASISMPANFRKGEVYFAGIGNSWRIPFHPPEGDKTEITLFYRGLPLGSADALGFRLLLEKEPHVIYEKLENVSEIPVHMESTVIALREILGNAGDNQLTNHRTGLEAPTFFLNKIQSIELCGRNALAVNGIFHSSDGEPRNFYQGLFFEGASNDEDCAVEELFFQSEDKALFEKYWSDFQDTYRSLVWA